MFTAITEKGSIINLFTMKDKDELKVLRSLATYCPECKGRVILKMGAKKITHFAHERKDCCSGNGEAESSYHLQGKLQLYQKLLQVNLQPELEPYYPEIKQRGDISFILHNKKYVIEFQCAVISPQLVKKRTAGYRKINIHPIWIIGFSHLKKWNPIKLKLTAFIYQFLTFYQGQYLLPTYCPFNKVFYLLQNPTPISVSQTFISTFSYPLVKLEKSLPKISSMNLHFSYWRELIHRQKTKDLHYPTKTNDHFLKELYARELHPHFLPPFIGIPVKEGFLIETPPLYWQAYVFLDSFSLNDEKKIYPLQKIYAFFQRRIKVGQIKIREFPFLTNIEWKTVVKHYLQMLVSLQVLEEIKPNFFRLLHQKKISNYEIQTQEEVMFYQRLKNLLDKQ
ncbi:competence protein CoiA [Niallia sp. JL1B1071]|uniref:competence protein CoiA n=1 Tax=Niallia tiangongensis TaxID=3237105 RepID=UPI0037DC0137